MENMNEPSPRIVSADALRELMERLLAAVGCDAESVTVTAEVLMEADLRGYGTHGLFRLPQMLRRLQEGTINPKARPHLTQEREGSALVDGDGSLGPVGGKFAADLAARKAGRAGCCSVGVVNSNHLCMAGYYGELIARAGFVGIVTSVTPPFVHPLGGSERILGTNPLAIAVPTEEEHPLLLDFATSAISYGRILTSRVSGAELPEGVALGPDGAPTTDADAAAAGAISPFGGHKGYGLALCLGLLAGPLVGAQVGKAVVGAIGLGSRSTKGDLMIAIDPAAFGDAEAFRGAAGAHVRELKNSRKAPGVEEIRIPGERSFAERERRLREGVPIAEGVWDEAVKMAEELDVPVPG